MDQTLPTPAQRRPSHDGPEGRSWAMHVTEARFCIVIECHRDHSPALHLVLTVPAGAPAEPALRASGWYPVGRWAWRSWGTLAQVEPGRQDDPTPADPASPSGPTR